MCQWTSESAGLDFRLLQLFSFLNSLSIRPGGGRRREQSNGRFGVHFSGELAGGRIAERRARVLPAAPSQQSGRGFSVSACPCTRRRLHRSRTVFSFSHRAAILEATKLYGSRRTVVLRSAAQPCVSSPAPSACCADREAVQHEMLYVLAVRQYGKYNLLNTCSMSQCRPLAWQVQMPHLDA